MTYGRAISPCDSLFPTDLSPYLHIDEANRVSALPTALFQPPPLIVNGPAVDYFTPLQTGPSPLPYRLSQARANQNETAKISRIDMGRDLTWRSYTTPHLPQIFCKGFDKID